MKKPQIIIVEDEILIADTIERYIQKNGMQAAAKTISFEETIPLLTNDIDLLLLDIRLYGEKSGIEIGQYIRDKQINIPFIYLTSQSDKLHLDLAKLTQPSGYLNKPIQKSSLISMIEVVLFNHRAIADVNHYDFTIKAIDKYVKLNFSDVMYIEADHVYVNLFLKSGEKLITRQSLKQLLHELPEKEFIQVHRSFLVNIQHIDKWNTNELFIGEKVIPLSRGRKKEVMESLNKVANFAK